MAIRAESGRNRVKSRSRPLQRPTNSPIGVQTPASGGGGRAESHCGDFYLGLLRALAAKTLQRFGYARHGKTDKGSLTAGGTGSSTAVVQSSRRTKRAGV